MQSPIKAPLRGDVYHLNEYTLSFDRLIYAAMHSTHAPPSQLSALCGLGMLSSSLGELLTGCAKPIATTKSWERAPRLAVKVT